MEKKVVTCYKWQRMVKKQVFVEYYTILPTYRKQSCIDSSGIHLCAQVKHAVGFIGPDLLTRDVLLPLPLECRASAVIPGSG